MPAQDHRHDATSKGPGFPSGPVASFHPVTMRLEVDPEVGFKPGSNGSTRSPWPLASRPRPHPETVAGSVTSCLPRWRPVGLGDQAPETCMGSTTSSKSKRSARPAQQQQ